MFPLVLMVVGSISTFAHAVGDLQGPVDPSYCADELLGYSRIQMATHLQRIPISRLTSDPYILLRGPEKLSDVEPARVITVYGEDRLLAIDARKANRIGVEAFFRNLIAAPVERASQLWLRTIEQRFAGYESEDFVLKGLASIWHNAESLQLIDRVFFMRFYDSRLESHLVQFRDVFVGPEKADRIALISLKVRDSATPPRLQVRASLPQPAKVAEPVQDPQDIWFQMKPRGGKQQIVKWQGGDSRPLRNTLEYILDKRFEIWNKYSTGTGTFIPVIRQTRPRNAVDVPADLYQIQFSETEKVQTYTVQRPITLSLAEGLSMIAARVRKDLEPAFVFSSAVGPVALPESLISAASVTKGSLEWGFQRLLSQRPELIAEIRGIPNDGQRLYIRLPFSSSRPSGYVQNFRGLSFVLYRGPSGQLYIIAQADALSSLVL